MNKNIYILLSVCSSIIMPLLLKDPWLSLAITFLIFSSLALSLDLILGKVGMFAMGHAMYFGIGAYTFTISINHYNLNIFLAIILSGITPFVLSLLLTKPILHLRGDYFLIVTIALNIIFSQIINNDPFGLTGGPNGIFGLTIPNVLGLNFSNDIVIYYIALFFLFIVITLSNNINYSKLGKALFLINQDEIAAKGLGINVSRLKQFTFSAGALIAGICGSIYILQNNSVSPESFDVTHSILLFAVVIIGGRGSNLGVIIGAFIMYVLPEIFRFMSDYRFLIFGITIVIVMIVRPNGLITNKYGFYKIKYLKK